MAARHETEDAVCVVQLFDGDAARAAVRVRLESRPDLLDAVVRAAPAVPVPRGSTEPVPAARARPLSAV